MSCMYVCMIIICQSFGGYICVNTKSNINHEIKFVNTCVSMYSVLQSGPLGRPVLCIERVFQNKERLDK